MNALFFAALCIIWGSTWMAIKINLTAFPPFFSAGFRFLLAGFVLFLIMRFNRPGFSGDFKEYRPSLVFGLLNGISYGLVYWGEQFIPSGLTAILNASMPFFSVIFAYLLIGELITVRKVAGMAVGFTGVLFLFYQGLAGSNRSMLPGELAIIMASAIYALAGVHLKKRSKVEPLEAVIVQMFASAAVLLAVAVPTEYNRVVSFSWPGLAAFLYLSLVGSALAFYLYNRLLLHMEISRLAYVAMITPGVAAILGAAWLGEVLHWQMLAGLALILTGIAVINLGAVGSEEKGRLED